MASFLVHLLRKNGGLYVSKYMKISLFLVQAYLSGEILKDTRALGISVGIAKGLPSFLPVALRASIRNRDRNTIRWLSSFLNAYKALSINHPDPEFETIEADPQPALERSMYGFGTGFSSFLSTFKIPKWDTSRYVPKFHLSAKSGPNGPGLVTNQWDAVCWALLYGDTYTPVHQWLDTSTD